MFVARAVVVVSFMTAMMVAVMVKLHLFSGLLQTEFFRRSRALKSLVSAANPLLVHGRCRAHPLVW